MEFFLEEKWYLFAKFMEPPDRTFWCGSIFVWKYLRELSTKSFGITWVAWWWRIWIFQKALRMGSWNSWRKILKAHTCTWIVTPVHQQDPPCSKSLLLNRTDLLSAQAKSGMIFSARHVTIRVNPSNIPSKDPCVCDTSLILPPW